MQGDSFSVKIKKPVNKIISLQLVHNKSAEEAVFPPFENKRELLEFKWHDKQLAYVALNSFGDPRIDTLFIERLPDLYKAKGLIVNLRYNGGGNTDIGTAILQYLTPDTLLFGAKSLSRLHILAYKAWRKFTSAADTSNNEWSRKAFLSFIDRYYYNFEYAPDTNVLNARRLVVPTVILLGHATTSSAEDFLIYADRQSHMIKMGEKSFGSTGQPFSFVLPGGGSARISTKKDTYPDGREFVSFGIKPDIEVVPSIAEYLQ
ncbi:MAG: S41 family peptidase [Ferruginibacter sp.]